MPSFSASFPTPPISAIALSSASIGRSITRRDVLVNTYRVRHASQSVNNTQMNEFAHRLRRLRQNAKLTQEQLADACGYSGQSRIANYESTGANARLPSLAEIPILAKALNVSEAELVASLPPEAQVAPAARGADEHSLEMAELQIVLGLAAKALASSIQPAGRELLDALEKLPKSMKGRPFVRKMIENLQSELPGPSAARSAQGPNARKRR